MTARRKNLLLVLLLLFVLLVAAGALGGVGIVELGIWLALVVVWVVAFATWGGRRLG